MEVLIIDTLAEFHVYGNLKDYPRVPDPVPMGSYVTSDVVFLLKNISSFIEEKGNEEREKAIQSGRHYSEMLPIEYKPTQEYIDLFHKSLKNTAFRIATATAVVSETIIKKRGKNVVLVSLARAGTPVGCLIKRYIHRFYDINLPHYSISIIRDKGLDRNALIYLIQRYPNCEIQFIDGWTGKGAITMELFKSVLDFERELDIGKDTICKDIAVLADPGYCANIYGTRDDFLIPSACLNSTVSGLMSRTVYRDDLVGPLDFHGAKFYRELLPEDLSNHFIDTVSEYFLEAHRKARALLKNNPDIGVDRHPPWIGKKETNNIKIKFGIKNINYVKPGVGETTRVLLRRVPWKILVKDIHSPDLEHVLLLAEDRGVPIEKYPDMTFSCCGLIKTMEENR